MSWCVRPIQPDPNTSWPSHSLYSILNPPGSRNLLRWRSMKLEYKIPHSHAYGNMQQIFRRKNQSLTHASFFLWLIFLRHVALRTFASVLRLIVLQRTSSACRQLQEVFTQMKFRALREEGGKKKEKEKEWIHRGREKKKMRSLELKQQWLPSSTPPSHPDAHLSIQAAINHNREAINRPNYSEFLP